MRKTRCQTHGYDISARRHEDRNSGRCALSGVNARPEGHDDIDILVDEICGGLGEPLGVAAGEAKLILDRFALDVAEFAKAGKEFAIARIGAGPEAEVADAREGTALLSARQRPSAKPGEEGAPSHSITWSAWASSINGMSRPSTLAVLRFEAARRRAEKRKADLDKARRLFSMHDDGSTVTEIAAALGCSIKTIRGFAAQRSVLI